MCFNQNRNKKLNRLANYYADGQTDVCETVMKL